LRICDAYRPAAVQQALWDVLPDPARYPLIWPVVEREWPFWSGSGFSGDDRTGHPAHSMVGTATASRTAFGAWLGMTAWNFTR
jgi:D-alanyl-D-alanine dipeptidase